MSDSRTPGSGPLPHELHRARRRLDARSRELDVLQELGRRAAEARTPDELLDSVIAALHRASELDLALVALGSLGLLASLMLLPSDAPRGRTLAVLGLIPFCLQTAVLDGIVWTALFPVPAY